MKEKINKIDDELLLHYELGYVNNLKEQNEEFQQELDKYKAKEKNLREYCEQIIEKSFEDEIDSDGTQEFLLELQAKRNTAEGVLNILIEKVEE